jgi:hypothetical protein
MNISVKVQANGFAEEEVAAIVAEALRTQTGQAEVRRNHYLAACREFEQKYNMSSDEFLERFESGELGDDEQWFSWYAVKQGFDAWDRRYNVLQRVAL